MTPQEIKDNAPDGANFYIKSNLGANYIKCSGGLWYIWQSSVWVKINLLAVALIKDSLRRIN